jgi:hypothetical protein
MRRVEQEVGEQEKTQKIWEQQEGIKILTRKHAEGNITHIPIISTYQ